MFHNNTSLYVHLISSVYGVPTVLEEDILQFAVFQPANVDVFLKLVKDNPMVKYAYREPLACKISDPCGSGGGGGGGGGPPQPDFVIAADPSSINLAQGTAGTSTITVGAANGFNGDVLLTWAISPNVVGGPTALLSQTTVSLRHDLFGFSTLTVSTTANTPTGSYTVTVTGTSGSLSHSAFIAIGMPPQNDPLLGNQWAIPDLNLNQAWQTSVGTRNRIVAVIDTGVMFNHPDLERNLWTAPDGSHGWDFIHNNNNPVDDDGHGTAVAGVIAGVINNGVGIAGAAQEQIMSVKVCAAGGGGCPIGNIAAGIRWAVDHGADVINLSIGGIGADPTEQAAVQYAWNNGAVLVGGAGNDALSAVHCPACYPEVIAVSALQQGRTLAPFSNFHSKVELTAPGVNIQTTYWPPSTLGSTGGPCPGAIWCAGPPCTGQLYCSLDGTSFATPFVSALAALVWDFNIQQGIGTLVNQNVRYLLDNYVVDLGPAGRDAHFGYGEPNALTLLHTVASHSYTLTARWEFFTSSGVESSAKVWVFDHTRGTSLLSGVVVGENGQVVNILPGDLISLYFDRYYNDGANNVYVARVDGTGGAPSYSDIASIACGRFFSFPESAASSKAIYYVSVTGDPFSDIICL